jgi:hypothetical protein
MDPIVRNAGLLQYSKSCDGNAPALPDIARARAQKPPAGTGTFRRNTKRRLMFRI